MMAALHPLDAPVAADPFVMAALAKRPVVAFSLSGGKDSTAAMHAAWGLLDQLGHPRQDRLAIHADLGRAEWKSTPAMVDAVAAHFGLRPVVVRHAKHDMVSRWEARFAEGKRRYAELEVYNLIGPWSSASLRFCTAELKQQVISPALRRAFPGRTIISVVGIRREESTRRSGAPISKAEPRWDRGDGTRILTWHPILDWSQVQVFDCHARHGLPLHEAYTVHGCSRVSCAFCVMQSEGDQRAAALAPGNRGLLHHLVDMEARSTFSFQPARWLGDAAPDLLPSNLRTDLATAKVLAGQRRALEASLPPGLRYVAGWPLRVPTAGEAAEIVGVRRTLLNLHGLPELFGSPESVISRFAELLDLKAEREARR